MEKDKQIDEILRDIEEQKVADAIVAENSKSDLMIDAIAEDARKKREEQIKGFSLDFDADSVVADATHPSDEDVTSETESDFDADLHDLACGRDAL